METPLSNSGNPPVKTAHRAPLALSGLDFKLLKVFKAVVEAGGFSAAQNELNVGLAAISKQISDLEIRIGMRLGAGEVVRGEPEVALRATGQGRQGFARAAFEASTPETVGGLRHYRFPRR